MDGCDPGNTGVTRPTYSNLGTVQARQLTDSDPSHYCNPPAPAIDIEKATNGVDADDPNAGTAAGFGPLLADISHWFRRRRGIAVAIVASGNYLSGAIWPIPRRVSSKRSPAARSPNLRS